LTIGIGGFSQNGAAVYGYSNGTGTGLRGVSTNGYGLMVTGNLRLSGGNTTPSAGALLTSVDAQGNAVWKDHRIAFSATNSLNKAIPHNEWQKVEFGTVLYDYRNNFVRNSGTTNDASSVFTVPVTGVYHLSANLNLYMTSSVYNFEVGHIYINRNGMTIAGSTHTSYDSPASSFISLNIDGDFRLVAGDKIWLIVSQKNRTGDPKGFDDPNAYPGRFTGHLVFAE
jgi:hypothetical protein